MATPVSSLRTDIDVDSSKGVSKEESLEEEHRLNACFSFTISDLSEEITTQASTQENEEEFFALIEEYFSGLKSPLMVEGALEHTKKPKQFLSELKSRADTQHNEEDVLDYISGPKTPLMLEVSYRVKNSFGTQQNEEEVLEYFSGKSESLVTIELEGTLENTKKRKSFRMELNTLTGTQRSEEEVLDLYTSTIIEGYFSGLKSPFTTEAVFKNTKIPEQLPTQLKTLAGTEQNEEEALDLYTSNLMEEYFSGKSLLTVD
ncbi:hypothetical protein BDQ17DRAFT_1413363 [Cyathus striatus]|nr:hypothetical protein BDQ17DRAFT_1413363 [Cyathus striatus]